MLWILPFIVTIAVLKVLIDLSKTDEKDMIRYMMKEIEKKIERLEREGLEALPSEGHNSIYEKLKGRCVR